MIEIIATLLRQVQNGIVPQGADQTAPNDAFAFILTTPLSEAERKQIQQIMDWLASIYEGKLSLEKMGKKLSAAIERVVPLFEKNVPNSAHERAFPFDFEPDTQLDLSFGQEFLAKCAEVHFDDLEMIEKAAMDLEAGNSEGMTLVKRFLHTMKGDFGVIGIADYADLIHKIEDLFEEHAATADQILRIKDFLLEAFRYFQKGIVPKLTQDISNYLTALPAEASKAILPEIVVEQPVTEAVVIVEAVIEPNVDSPKLDSDSEHRLPPTCEDEQALDRNLKEDPSLITDFIIESKEGLELVVPQIMDLDTGDLEIVNRLFRACHTMKGLCGFIGLPCLGGYAHILEDLLSEIRHGGVVLSADIISLLQESFDLLYELILSVERRVEGNTLKYPDSLEPLYAKLLSIRFNEPEVIEPSVEAQVYVEPLSMCEPIASPIDEVIPEPLALVEVQQLVEDHSLVDSKKQSKASVNTEQRIEVDEMIRVSTRKLDQLIDTIGETVIAQSMLEADSHIADLQDLILEKKLAQSNLLIRRIQELSMSLRMVPIQGVFQKMSRLIRDLSKKMNKNVRLSTLGEETELDKSIVEQIADPLMHMVRNSMDHGLESMDERIQAGKPSQGSLHLRAFNQSGAIFIEIEDDGRGLDTERILTKAVNQGLCTADAVLSDQDIFKFIFHPGFSTAAKITDVSGRGVGMDVVKKNIDALRGSIVIQSEKGKGTLFSIRLPLTLAIIDGMVVRCGDQNLIIPTLSIVQSVKCIDKAHTVSEPDGTMLYDFLGSLIPIVGMLQIYGMSASKAVVNDGVIIVVEDMEGNRVGLLADEILGQQQIVIKNLGQWVGAVPGIAGGAIMNSGAISLIVDIPELIRMCKINDASLQLVCWTESLYA